MRRMVQKSKIEEAPKEIWLEFSVLDDGTDPVCEHDWLKVEPENDQCLRYILAESTE